MYRAILSPPRGEGAHTHPAPNCSPTAPARYAILSARAWRGRAGGGAFAAYRFQRLFADFVQGCMQKTSQFDPSAYNIYLHELNHVRGIQGGQSQNSYLWMASIIQPVPQLVSTRAIADEACAHAILQRGAQHGLIPLAPLVDPAASHWMRGTGINHIYLLHYRGNVARRRYQELQLPNLGINTSIVVAFDQHELDDTVRSCHALCDPSTAGVSAAMYTTDNRTRAMYERDRQSTSICHSIWATRFSAALKLYVALYDMVWRSFPAALILEDDVQIKWTQLDNLGTAVRNTTSAAVKPRDRLAVLFASSYSSSGLDNLCCDWRSGRHHVNLRPNKHRGHGLMPAVGVVVTTRGARHLLRSLPITDNNDVILSDSRGRAGSQHGLWYSKPYVFVPAEELQFECLSALELRAANPLGHKCPPQSRDLWKLMPVPRPGFAVPGLDALSSSAPPAENQSETSRHHSTRFHAGAHGRNGSAPRGITRAAFERAMAEQRSRAALLRKAVRPPPPPSSLVPPSKCCELRLEDCSGVVQQKLQWFGVGPTRSELECEARRRAWELSHHCAAHYRVNISSTKCVTGMMVSHYTRWASADS